MSRSTAREALSVFTRGMTDREDGLFFFRAGMRDARRSVRWSWKLLDHCGVSCNLVAVSDNGDDVREDQHGVVASSECRAS